MKTSEQILQYHIDHNLKRVSKKHSASLSIAQRKQLQAELELHSSLSRLKVKKSVGRNSLQIVLQEITEEPVKRSTIQPLWKFSIAGVALLIIVFIVGGFNFLHTTSTSQLSSDNIQPNGSVENLQNLNQVDAENDIKLVETASAVSEADFAKSSTIEEAIDENF